MVNNLAHNIDRAFKFFERLIVDIVLDLMPVVMFFVLEYTYRRDYGVPSFMENTQLPFDFITHAIAEFLGGGHIRWFTYYLFLFAALVFYILVSMFKKTSQLEELLFSFLPRK